jgi:hypothetical protein
MSCYAHLNLLYAQTARDFITFQIPGCQWVLVISVRWKNLEMSPHDSIPRNVRIRVSNLIFMGGTFFFSAGDFARDHVSLLISSRGDDT